MDVLRIQRRSKRRITEVNKENMLNIEKYKEDILNMSHANITCCVGSLNHVEDCTNRSCKECKKEALKWLLEEYKKPILDDAEKRYLRGVIRPFRNDVLGIKKNCVDDEYIVIIIKDFQTICLPYFKNGTMYKGMVTNKEYTLEELGL